MPTIGTTIDALKSTRRPLFRLTPTPSTLMLAYALIIAAWAGASGADWTIVLPLPHLLAYFYLKAGLGAP